MSAPSMVAMKVRSCMLILCMLVVPALALFSHLAPPSARIILRRTVCDPFCRAITSLSARLPSALVGSLQGTQRPAAAARPTASTAGTDEASGLVPVVSRKDDSIAALEPVRLAHDMSSVIPAMPMVTVAGTIVADSTPHDGPGHPQAAVAASAELRTRLTALGATSIECKQQPGDATVFAGTCRIRVDRDGQLHRMFHGRGANETAAMQSLVDQIETWQSRQAGGAKPRY